MNLTAVLDAARAGSGYECSHIVAKKGESELHSSTASD